MVTAHEPLAAAPLRMRRSTFLRTVFRAALAPLAFPQLRARAGGLFTNGTTDQQTRDFAASFAPGSALSLRIYSPLFTGNPPGQANASATFLNSGFALTARHTFQQVISQLAGLEVADGPNYLTNRGNVAAVASYVIHPSLDLVLLRLAQPFLAGPARTIGTANVGDITYAAGYGWWGTPATGWIARDGFVRGFDARVDNVILPPYLPPFHQTTLFGWGNLAGLQRNARGANGDSGGPVEAGPPIHSGKRALVGVLVGATTATVSSNGATAYVYLGEPSTKAWIEANTQLPKPVLEVVRGAGGEIVVTWGAQHMEWGWVLQSSSDLGSDSWTDLGGLRTTAGTHVAASVPRQFFRFRPW